ncbi:MAG: hypothetical protein M9894_28685 [Planctomycetes bacterium]|nr:hypothetical protein [Planctomycetota bacterium]
MVGSARLHHFLAVCAVLLGLALLLAAELGPLAQERPVVAGVAAFAVGIPPVVAMTRLTQVGCGALVVAVGLHLLARALGRPPLEGLTLFAAPGWLFVGWELALRPLLARAEERRALLAVDTATVGHELAALLGHASPLVRERAARRLGGAFPPDVAFPLLHDASTAAAPDEREAAHLALLALARHPDGWSRVRDLLRERVRDPADAVAAEAARTLAQLDAQGDLVASEAPGEARPAVRVAYAEGLLRATSASDGTGSRRSLAATLLAHAMSDPATDEALRARALEAIDRVPGREARAAACPLLARAETTAELLWVFVDHGQPEDAPLLARWVASDRYEVCNAAVEALEAVVDRAGGLGPDRLETLSRLEEGKARLRAVHPPGDNPLADGLVERLEGLAEALGATT